MREDFFVLDVQEPSEDNLRFSLFVHGHKSNLRAALWGVGKGTLRDSLFLGRGKMCRLFIVI